MTVRSPSLLLPHVHCLERATVSEMLREKFTQQTLMRSHGVFIERYLPAGEHLPQGSARIRRKRPARWRQASAAGTQCASRSVTEERGHIRVERRMTFS